MLIKIHNGKMILGVLMVCHVLFGTSGAEKCRLFDYCRPDGVCRSFTSLSEVSKLAEECLKTDEQLMLSFFDPKMVQKQFMSTIEQDMNKEFDIHLWRWIFYKNRDMFNQSSVSYMLYLYNIAQIDYTGYSSDYMNRDTSGYEFSHIIIQLAHSTRFDQSPCDQNTSSWNKFLLTHSLQIQGGRYLTYMCPLWFKDVELTMLTIKNNHGFKFREVANLDQVNLASNISSLELSSIHKLELDQSILSSYVFGNLTALTLATNSLSKISPTNLFEDFWVLGYLDFSVINVRGFFHSVNGTEWIPFLNSQVYMPIEELLADDMSPSDYQYIAESVMSLCLSPMPYENDMFPYYWYIYPDEDICLFSNFPHQQLVVPIIKTFYSINCSCTLLWLLKYNSLVYHRYNFSFIKDGPFQSFFHENSPCDPENMTNFKQAFESCNMTHRLSLCTIEKIPANHDPYFDFYDLKNGIQAAHVYLLDYAGPVISFIGSMTNLIIVIVFLHNRYDSRQFKSKEKTSAGMMLLSERLYQLMFINAIVNLIYCLMYLLDFTITCTPTPYLIDHNYITFNTFVLNNCLVKDSVVGFIGSTLKIVSNTLLVFISLNRYLLIGKEHHEIVTKLTSISNKKLLIWSTFVASLLSVIVVFQYITWSNQKVVYSENVDKALLYAYDNYPFYDNYILRPQSVVKRLQQISVVIAFSVIHDCFSYLFFCLIILILDIATIKKLRETLAQHVSMVKTVENELHKQKAEKKSIIMVWINSIVNFVLRLPEILSMVCFIFFDVNPYIYKVLCLMFSRCLTLYDFSNVAYILSLSTPLFFYLGFNTNFYVSLKALCQFRSANS